MSIDVLLVESHLELRETLCSLIQKTSGMCVVGEASSGEDALILAEKIPVDVMVLSIPVSGLLSGIEMIRLTLSKYAHIRVLALTTYSDEQFINFLFDAGAKGCVPKVNAFWELVDAIRTIAKSEILTDCK